MVSTRVERRSVRIGSGVWRSKKRVVGKRAVWDGEAGFGGGEIELLSSSTLIIPLGACWEASPCRCSRCSS